MARYFNKQKNYLSLKINCHILLKISIIRIYYYSTLFILLNRIFKKFCKLRKIKIYTPGLIYLNYTNEDLKVKKKYCK